MIKTSTKVAVILFFCFVAFHYAASAQATPQPKAPAKDANYTIELKILRPEINLTGENSNIIFTVTVVNHASQPVDFGYTLDYGYKKFHSHDFYLEATDMEGNRVDIDGEDDNEFTYDPPDDNTKNVNKIVQKINSSAYYFRPGKYKLRWVYDPSANRFTPPNVKINPVFSNWDVLSVAE
jgi:hypothetical protein